MESSTEHLSEEQLIELCIKKNSFAQKRLYDIYASKMFAVCLRYSDNRESAKDILQDGFVTVFEKIGTYSGNGSFEGWMRKIFVNTALMSLRKNDVLKYSEQIEEIPLYELQSTHANIIEDIDVKVILELIAQMPAGYRTVFNLNVVEGYSHQEIAQMLGITEAASRSQLSRGKGWLQERLKKLMK